MTKIYTAADEMEAMALSDALKAQGIEACTFSEGSGDYVKIVWGMSMKGNGIYVQEEDEKSAAEIIKQHTARIMADSRHAGEPGYDADMAGAVTVPWYRNRMIAARAVLGWLAVMTLLLCIFQILF